MEIIKFRAWDKFQKKYIFEGFHVCGEVTAFGLMEITLHETWAERSKALNYKSTLEAWDDFIFEQFTGITDKNGKDIYDGDKVVHNIRTRGNLNAKYNKYFTITFKDGAFCLTADHEYHGSDNSITIRDTMFQAKAKGKRLKLEVIGNIHESPK